MICINFFGRDIHRYLVIKYMFFSYFIKLLIYCIFIWYHNDLIQMFYQSDRFNSATQELTDSWEKESYDNIDKKDKKIFWYAREDILTTTPCPRPFFFFFQERPFVSKKTHEFQFPYNQQSSYPNGDLRSHSSLSNVIFPSTAPKKKFWF